MVKRFLGLVVLGLLSQAGSVQAQGPPCLLTPGELEAATGRSFASGVPGKDVTGMSDQCAYAEKAKPQRRAILMINRVNAKAQFESQKRLLRSSKDAIDLEGIGEGAYFSGTAAGVFTNDTVITLHGLRRASDPKIEPAKVSELLRLALKRLAR